MKETGMLFTSPMVRAILEGRKTQTRRIVKPAPETDQRLQPITTETGLVYARSMEKIDYPNLRRIRWESPVGQPGDRIYVRETFSQHPEWGQLAFRADGKEFEDADGWLWEPKWMPSIHMPKELARIWLEITGVRVERLQSISRGDAMAEGCPFPNMADDADPRQWFAEVWDSTTDRPTLPKNESSKRYTRVKNWLDTHPDTMSWAANPLVWVIDFKRIEKP